MNVNSQIKYVQMYTRARVNVFLLYLERNTGLVELYLCFMYIFYTKRVYNARLLQLHRPREIKFLKLADLTFPAGAVVVRAF